MNKTFSELIQRINALLQTPRSEDEKLRDVCLMIHTELPDMDWVGFYMMDDAKKVLVLGPYVGDPTDHTVIPNGKGICGQVAISGRTLNVPDVSQGRQLPGMQPQNEKRNCDSHIQRGRKTHWPARY